MDRRKLLGSAVVAGVTGLVVPEAAPAAAAQTARVIDSGLDPAVARVREAQRRHLQATRQYPAVIEVGVDVWEHVYDWFVRYLQPNDARRLADGCYAMTFMFTTLLLRPDQAPDYVSPPYDTVPLA